MSFRRLAYGKNKLYALLSGLFFIFTGSACAEDITVDKNLFRSTFEIVVLPGDEDMGLMGIDYLFTNEMGFYYGLGIYGAMSGERGGFFTGGIELGYQLHLYRNIMLDVGIFGGGGGGGSAPQGGGLMLRPHAGLLYDALSWRVGLAYSKVKFPNGDIDSDHVALQLDMPFESVSSKTKDSESLYRSLSLYSEQYDFGWADHYFAAVFQQYFPLSGTKDTSGREDLENIGLIGFEYGSYINQRWFTFLETTGAFKGGAGGYAEVLGGMGYDFAFSKSFGLKAKLSLGSAGGGRVDTGGGFVYKANAGLYYTPVRELTINAETGYVDAPDGSFNALAARFSLSYNMTFLGVSDVDSHIDDYKDLTSTKWNFRIVNQTYLASDTIRYNDQGDAVQLIGVKFDRNINEYFYITGQAFGAYDGDVGGYASGLLGMGCKTPRLFEKISFYLELLGGSGAGGGVATEGGAIMQPMAGIEYKITKSIGVQAGIGRIKSFRGTLDTTVADIGFVYSFGKVGRR